MKYLNKINKTRNLHETLFRKKRLIDNKLENIYSFIIEKIKLNTSKEINDNTFSQIKEELINQAHILKAKIDEDHRKNKEKTEDLLMLQNNIEKLESTIAINKLKITEYQTNPEFVAMQKKINDMSLRFEKNEINLRMNQFQETKSHLNEKLKRNIEHNEILKSICAEKGYDETNEALFTLREKKEALLKKIHIYELTFRDLMPNLPLEEISINLLNAYFKKQDNKLFQLSASIKNIFIVIEHLEFIEQNNILKSKQKRLKLLQENFRKISVTKDEIIRVKEISKAFLENKIKQAFNHKLINDIYSRIDPHPDLSTIEFKPDFTKDKMDINVTACGPENSERAPVLYFSSAQLNILSLSIFLARTFQADEIGLNTIFMDDPIQHLDSINILSFIDLLRTITSDLDRQIIISTHNINFFSLLKRKLDPAYYDSKFIELSAYGSVR